MQQTKFTENMRDFRNSTEKNEAATLIGALIGVREVVRYQQQTSIFQILHNNKERLFSVFLIFIREM